MCRSGIGKGGKEDSSLLRVAGRSKNEKIRELVLREMKR